MRSQWQLYQLGKIPEEFYNQEVVSKTQHNAQFSYRKQAYELFELNEPDKQQKNCKKTDSYWYKVSKLTNGTGNFKCLQLFNRVKVIICLSHGYLSASVYLSAK